jgi:hypothetical protein
MNMIPLKQFVLVSSVAILFGQAHLQFYRRVCMKFGAAKSRPYKPGPGKEDSLRVRVHFELYLNNTTNPTRLPRPGLGLCYEQTAAGIRPEL